MKKQPEGIYSQVMAFSELSLKEESIMREYQKLQYSQETPQYSIETMHYLQIPNIFPTEVKKLYKECIFLDKFTFYEMFTMLIFEYLYKDITEQKKKKIKQLKALVCEQKFLQGNFYTKGLILNGFKELAQYQGMRVINHPLGQVLLTSDCILAFTECWKELTNRICESKGIPNIQEGEIDSSIFQLFAGFFEVNFNVHWKQKKNRFWKESFTFERTDEKIETLSVVVNPDYQISISQRSLRVTQSRAGSTRSLLSTIDSSWNYIVLTNPPIIKNEIFAQYEIEDGDCSEAENNNKRQIKESMMNAQEISNITEIQYSYGETDGIKILLDQDKCFQNLTARKVPAYGLSSKLACSKIMKNVQQTMKLGYSLIDQMREYSQYLSGFSDFST